MRNKKIFMLILTLIATFALTGCQLALQNGATGKSQDKLIGVYVSYDYVDLFDFESYMNNNLKFSGGEIKIDGTTQKYEGRMYATRKDKVKTVSQGEKYTETIYVFEETPGIGLFTPTIIDPINPDVICIASGGDEGFSDVKRHVKSGDNEDGLELEGTVYIPSGSMSSAIYINPVYQSADGSIYLISGQGFSATGDNSEGGVYSQTLTDTVTVTENGKIKSFSTSVKVSIATMNPTKTVTIIQMDKDSNLLKKDYYKPEEVPETLFPEKAADYIIVESAKESFDKQPKIERTLFSKGDNSLWFFRNGDGKIFIKSYIAVQLNKS